MSNKTIKMEFGKSNRPGRSVARQTASLHSPVVSSFLRAGRDGLQAKLRINPPGDVYEQEADRVAEQVMSMSDMRLSAAGDYLRLKDSTAHAGAVQRVCASCADDETLIQTKQDANTSSAWTPSINAGVRSLQGGQPLSELQRNFFEPRIGADFSQVRFHHDTRAAAFANSINARAFTLSNNVVFGAGEYSPESSSGKKLLAHELTHVVQQNGGASDSLALTLPRTEPVIQRDMTDPGRLSGVHGDVMVQGPPRRTGGGSSAARRAWVDPTPGNGGTAELLFNQTYTFLKRGIRINAVG